MRLGLLAILAVSVTWTGMARAQAIPVWRISDAPTLRLGDDGSPEREFTRIVGAFLLNDGRIAVVENASSEVRVFERDGRWTRSVGRKGSGPGEFQFLLHAFRAGDTLFVFDPMLKRVSAVVSSGEPRVAYGRTFSARGGRPFDVRGRTTDGRWVTQYDDSPGWDSPPGVKRGRGGAGLAAADGDGNVRWLAELPGTASFAHNPTGDITRASSGPIAFTPRIYATGSGPYAWFGESGSASLVRYDVRTGARRSVRLPIEPHSPTAKLIALSRADDLAMDPRASTFINAKYSAEYLPRTLPYFEGVVPTGSGGIWVQAYAGAREVGASYFVLDAEGRALATVVVPARFRITDVRGETVVGLYRDEDGLDEVRVYVLMQR